MPKQKKQPPPIDWEAERNRQDTNRRLQSAGEAAIEAKFAGHKLSRENIQSWGGSDAQAMQRALDRITSGDLGVIQEVLLGQLMALNAGFEANIHAASLLDGANGRLAAPKYALALEYQKASVKTARALADISRPKAVTFVKTQQNALVVTPEHVQQPTIAPATGEPIEYQPACIPVEVA